MLLFLLFGVIDLGYIYLIRIILENIMNQVKEKFHILIEDIDNEALLEHFFELLSNLSGTINSQSELYSNDVEIYQE